MNVAVLYQSLRGGTERAASRIGLEFIEQGAIVGVYPVANFDSQFVLRADLLVLGTWTDGLFGIAAKPAQMSKLAALPSIAHKDTALFVTYEISPTQSLRKLTEWAEHRGARVIASAGFNRRKVDDGVGDFVRHALAGASSASV